MHRLSLLLLAWFAMGAREAMAQDAPGPCATPAAIAVAGNSRVTEATILSSTGLRAGDTYGYRDIQRAIELLFGSGQFDDVQVSCSLDQNSRATLVVTVRERPILSGFTITGVNRVSDKDVKDRLEQPVGAAVDPGRIALSLQRADSLYESKGYYLAKIRVDSTITDGKIALAFVVDEGRRLAVSGVRIHGNSKISDDDIVGAMKTKPEGFLFYRSGEFDEIDYAGDLSERIPRLYGSRGFIDLQVLSDSMIVDRELGKAMIDITVREGPRYQIGSFEVLGNRRFPTEAVKEYYPFGEQQTTLAGRATSLLRRAHRNPPNTFDAGKWTDAEQKLMEAYSNEGYIYARVNPILERVPGTDSVRTVNLRWEIEERSPAIVNRIDIAGNDYTNETCIREQLVLIPGQVFNRQALIRSYQNISNMNFFEAPMPAPDTRPSGDAGDVDIVFNVKEKRTGNLNFGASMGQGTGLGGFVGMNQPNLFGKCKRVELQWQFGRYINDFNGTYTDPNIRQSRISGSATAYHTRSRFRIADLGQSTRTGGQLQFGFPVPWSYYTRLFVSYGGESVRYSEENSTLLGQLARDCKSCFRSTLGITGTHDTRIGLPFPVDGGLQTIAAQFNGGPLGGTSNFQRYSAELRSYAPLAAFGNQIFGGQPMQLVTALSAKGGVLFGNPGPFFYSQSFALGGTQYGEQLRGYDEFSITPSGYDPTAETSSARRESFGNAYFTATAELGLRLSSALYVHTFAEGGNVWDRPREFNPTRLFRSVGFGAATLSPLGPLGIDLGYGLDKTDALGRRAPGWKLHFKLGQLF
ncbi:MAG TPA: outer membrane protein assembly factor BamA [Gemmatimonadaceae bacterium]|nr:outer membrane protein assembly factor BamA [Gemmatimonadaceae bacterium]